MMDSQGKLPTSPTPLFPVSIWELFNLQYQSILIDIQNSIIQAFHSRFNLLVNTLNGGM
jgi:hypothetical protein